jgi:hypothetical protein
VYGAVCVCDGIEEMAKEQGEKERN